jgi:hypothetical protein
LEMVYDIVIDDIVSRLYFVKYFMKFYGFEIFFRK